jgi:hypothetical protein
MVHVLSLAQREYILETQMEPTRQEFLRHLREIREQDGTQPPEEPQR